MKQPDAIAVNASDALPATFVRGAVASGIVAAVKDSRTGADVLQSALLGGGALSAAVAVENLLFNREWKVANGKKRGKKKRAAMERAALEALLSQNQPSGLAALTPGQQFLIGTLVGAGAAYVLGDEQMRGKLLRAGLQFYGKVADGFEEIKEQMGDIQAELAAQRMSGG
jgi:hypothetical protein